MVCDNPAVATGDLWGSGGRHHMVNDAQVAVATGDLWGNGGVSSYFQTANVTVATGDLWGNGGRPIQTRTSIHNCSYWRFVG